VYATNCASCHGTGGHGTGDIPALSQGPTQSASDGEVFWYAVDGERIGQGRETARQFLKDNPDIRNEIDSRLRKGLGLPMPDAIVEKPKGEKADVLPMPMQEKKKA
jgi:recombination protein RecA